eukprot:3391161-Rhodomonas_salina.1
MEGRKLTGAERLPAGTGWKQRGSCSCASGKGCEGEGVSEGGTTGVCEKSTRQKPGGSDKNTSATEGEVPAGADAQPSVDANATARSFTCGHP